MSYTQDVGQVSALYRPPGEVEELKMGSGTLARFVAPGTVTEGRFGLYEWNMPPETGGATPHFHKTFSESFYVISGVVRLYDGDRWVAAKPGDFLYVPEGGVHGFSNDGQEAASMLILFAPGAPREDYFRELVEISDAKRTLTEEEWDEMMARHDQYRAT